MRKTLYLKTNKNKRKVSKQKRLNIVFVQRSPPSASEQSRRLAEAIGRDTRTDGGKFVRFIKSIYAKKFKKGDKKMLESQLEKIARGAVQEKFSRSFARVIENVLDPNTSFKDARKITITLKFTQNEGRDDVSCDVSVVEKLAATVPTKTSFAVGKGLKTGRVYAEEYGRNQMSIDDMKVDRETGEVTVKVDERVADYFASKTIQN